MKSFFFLAMILLCCHKTEAQSRVPARCYPTSVKQEVKTTGATYNVGGQVGTANTGVSANRQSGNTTTTTSTQYQCTPPSSAAGNAGNRRTSPRSGQ
jgi:hypothetical protein